MPHYKNAPIREAVIDIKAKLPSGMDLDKLHAIGNQISKDYPREEARLVGEGVFQFGQEVKATAQQRPWGIVFWNAQNTQVVQARLDGFAFSRLTPYENFVRLRDEARRLWGTYYEVAMPTKITRVGVRYINQLDLPGPRVEPEQYFNVYPLVSPLLPADRRDFGPFLLNLVFPQDDLRGALVLRQALLPPKAPGVISIVLDFDLSVEAPPVTNEQQLWDFFDRLRERKNQYFEACITDKTRELIS